MNQKSNNKNKINIKFILNLVIFGCLGMILMFTYIVYDEITSAKEECEIINGTYKLNILTHLCDNEVFYKYSNGNWGFDRT